MPVVNKQLGTRAYVGNRFYLELGRQAAGWLYSAEGGQASTEIMTDRLAGGYPVRKKPGSVKFDDITLVCGTGMSRQFYSWLQKSISYDHERKEGSIVGANYDFKEVSRLDFLQGLVTELGFPALDAKSKDPAKMTVKIAPERTMMTFNPQGGKSISPAGTKASIQKQWLVSNFRLRIDGMPCAQTSKIEALTIKQKVVENPVGEEEIADREPAQIDFPDLTITIPEVDAGPWYKWHDEFVIQGKSSEDNEKTGSLDFMTSDLKTALFTLSFKSLGIVKFTPDKFDSSTDAVRNVKIQMYCESIDFEYGPNATWQ